MIIKDKHKINKYSEILKYWYYINQELLTNISFLNLKINWVIFFLSNKKFIKYFIDIINSKTNFIDYKLRTTNKICFILTLLFFIL